MTALALLSGKGSPGVTTSALLLAAVWPVPACLVEADPAGGDLRWWLTDPAGQPLQPGVGLVSLHAAVRAAPGTAPTPPVRTVSGADAGAPTAGTAVAASPGATARGLGEHAQAVPGGLPVLVGVGSSAQHRALPAASAALVAALAADVELDAVVDLGRLGQDPSTAVLLERLPLVLLVCRPTVASVSHTRSALAVVDALRRPTPTPAPALARDADGCGLPAAAVLVIGSSREREDVRAALADTEARVTGRSRDRLVVGLPEDPAAARALAGEWTRRLDRSPLVAGGRRLAGLLHAQLSAPAAPEPAAPAWVPFGGVVPAQHGTRS